MRCLRSVVSLCFFKFIIILVASKLTGVDVYLIVNRFLGFLRLSLSFLNVKHIAIKFKSVPNLRRTERASSFVKCSTNDSGPIAE